MFARTTVGFFLAIVVAMYWPGSGFAQDTMDEILRYREMLAEANPAELLELEGELLWTTPRGPKNATLEQCDLGLGPGVLRGAYTQLPRYFADTGKVQDAESRIVTCIMELQGLSLEEATRGWYKPGSENEALVTFVATQSRGEKIDVPAVHPREAELYAIGEALFFRRAGPLDFACSTCHGLDDRRIRLQELPNLSTRQGAQASMSQWPAYRVSQGVVWTMQRRLIDCIRQMRWPEPEFLSEAVIALEIYMQNKASGVVSEAPGIKR
jgi:L-cysteine S-thiosulfotransferase